ncbi:SCO-spondin-like [Haliotis rubra]|uniref:SCO-spondin-like n=1 Tax=Haliotis rubra TaxID=36100 RepID=UPI001EE51709|nr:SCO-spondin-like [Haliotis rubra]
MLSKVKAVHLLGTLLAIISLSQVCHTIITQADAKALKHHMLDTLAFIHPSNKTNFVKFCLHRHFCSHKSFAPRPGYFHWRDGTSKAEQEGFWQTYTCVLKSDIKLCPIDGQWSLWVEWSACSAACQGVGNRTRTRQCNNPLPANHGLGCFGRSVDIEVCSGKCNNSALANGLKEAEEHLEEVHKAMPQLRIECLIGHCTYNTLKKFLKPFMRDKYWSHLICYKYKRACPVDGGWSAWGAWSECTVACGNGYLYRQRACTSPSPVNGGQTCPGQAYQKKSCVAKKCSHITGREKAVFSEWSKFSPCSVSCGTYGSQVTRRSCLLKGKCLVRGETVANLIISKPCFQGACPRKGGWSDWSEWTDCSAVCGEGRKTRLRMCADPYPSGGEGCLGPEVETSDCNRSQPASQNKTTPVTKAACSSNSSQEKGGNCDASLG